MYLEEGGGMTKCRIRGFVLRRRAETTLLCFVFSGNADSMSLVL